MAAPPPKKPRRSRRVPPPTKPGYMRVANWDGIYSPERGPERVRRMALMGQTDPEIAGNFGITEMTLRQWIRKYPEFRAALSEGRAEADENVAESLYKRAVGMAVPAVKVGFAKDGKPLYAPYVENLPPDVGAAMKWLTNRQPGRWKERREVDMTITLEQQIAQMTPEERKARLVELQAKAGLLTMIEGEAVEVEDEPGTQ